MLIRHVMLMTLVCVAWPLTACTQDSRAGRHTFGEIDADEIDVASRLPGRIKTILVRPGQVVKAGDPLVEFEDDLMAVKKQGALATIAAAESKRSIAHDAVRPQEKEQLQAAVNAAKKQMDFAEATFRRAENLLKEGAIAQQAFDEIEFKYKAAQESHRAALAKLKLANIGARPEEKAAADALVEQARSVLKEVEAYEKDMILRAPLDAEVAQIVAMEGELVPTGYAVVTLVKTSEPYVVFSVPETRLQTFAKDRPVIMSIPALGDREIKGVVTYVAPMATFATRTFTQDKASFDLKTFELRASLDAIAEGLRPGMTAVVRPLENGP